MSKQDKREEGIAKKVGGDQKPCRIVPRFEKVKGPGSGLVKVGPEEYNDI